MKMNKITSFFSFTRIAATIAVLVALLCFGTSFQVYAALADEPSTSVAPDAPTNVLVTKVEDADQTLNITWDINTEEGAGTDIDHFNIYCNGVLTKQVYQSAFYEADGKYYWETLLSVDHPWQNYLVEVTAVNTQGIESEKSTQCSSSTGSDKNAVESWNVEATSTGVVIEASTMFEGNVRVYRGDELIGLIENTSNGAAGSYTDKAVEVGTNYVYRLVATNKNGDAGTETVTFSLIVPSSSDTKFCASEPSYSAREYDGTVTLNVSVRAGETVLVCRNGVVKATYQGGDASQEVVFKDTPTDSGSYRYYVVASDRVNYAGQSAGFYYDKLDNREVIDDRPDTPTVRSQVTSDGMVILEWDAVECADTYRLFVERGDGGKVTPEIESVVGMFDEVDSATTRYVFSPKWGLNNSGEPIAYRFSVCSYMVGAGQSVCSEPVSYVSDDEGNGPIIVFDAAPGEPIVSAELVGGETDLDHDYLALSWKYASTGGGVSYYVIKTTDPAGKTNEYRLDAAYNESTLFLESGEGIYKIEVTAANEKGEATTTYLYNYGAVPELSVSQTSQGYAKLTWVAPEDAVVASYVVFRKTPYTLAGPIATCDANTLTYVDEGVEGNLAYSYYVVAKTAEDERVSEVVDFEVDEKGVVCSASTLTVNSTSEGIVLSWSLPSDGEAEMFLLEARDTTAGQAWEECARVVVSTTDATRCTYTYLDTSELGCTFEFRVRCSNSGGTGPISNVVSVKMIDTYQAPSSVPGSVTTTASVANGAVVLTFAPASSADPQPTYYHITKWYGDMEEQEEIYIAGFLGTWTDTNVDGNTEYMYLVRAGNSYGEHEQYSAADIVTILASSSDDEDEAIGTQVSALIVDNVPVAKEVSEDDRETINEIEKIYNALTAEQKNYVTPEALTRLREAVKALVYLSTKDADREAAALVEQQAAELPALDEATIDDADAIANVLFAYNRLTDDQKALVSSECVELIDQATEKFKKVQLEYLYNLLKEDPCADGHEWGEWSANGDATCETDGTKTRACTRTGCGASETVADSGSAKGHAWDAGVVTTPATCEAAGVRTYTCKNDPTHTYTETIAATGHEWGEWSPNGDATCEADGTKTRTCTHAGCSASETIADAGSAKGHTWDAGVVTTPATCENPGVRTYTCKNDPNHTRTEVIEALGHQVVADPAVAATCTSAGKTAGSHCGRCGKVLVEQSATAKADHAPASAVRENEVSAQVGIDGSYDEVIYCKECGKEMSRTSRTIPALEPDPAPAPDPDPDPAPSPSATGVEGFVERLYYNVMGRVADEAGKAAQVAGMRSMGAAQITYNFYNSKEFANKSATMTNAEIVENVYQTMLGRSADEGGLAMWKGYLDNGMSACALVAGFAESQEFSNVCASYGIGTGSADQLRSMLQYRDRVPGVTAFASRMYTVVLSRDAEIDGLNVQCEALIGGTACYQIAYNFFKSDEFANKGYTSEQVVRIAYAALLGREQADIDSDVAGIAYWVERLEANGLKDMVMGFCQSNEFEAICQDCGMTSGMR